MMVFSFNLLSGRANKDASLAAQKDGKITIFSFCCRASPCPIKDHRCSGKTKTTAETETKMARMAKMTR